MLIAAYFGLCWFNFINCLFNDYKIENKEIEPDEEPSRCIMWLKGRLNKHGEFENDELRSVGDKLVSLTANFVLISRMFNLYVITLIFPYFVQKTTEEKIKEGTLTVDHGNDAMTLVFGKDKGGYARGVGSRVTYNRYFDLPRSRQSSDARVAGLERQLEIERRERENERREREEKDRREREAKDKEIKDLNDKMAQTQGMVTHLVSQLAAQGVKLTPNGLVTLVSIKTFQLHTFNYFCLSYRKFKYIGNLFHVFYIYIGNSKVCDG